MLDRVPGLHSTDSVALRIKQGGWVPPFSQGKKNLNFSRFYQRAPSLWKCFVAWRSSKPQFEDTAVSLSIACEAPLGQEKCLRCQKWIGLLWSPISSLQWINKTVTWTKQGAISVTGLDTSFFQTRMFKNSDCSMMRNVALNLVSHDTDFYIQIPGNNFHATQKPDLAPLNSRGNLPEYKESISGLLIAFSLLALLFLSLAFLPCKELWSSCRKTSGYLGKCVLGRVLSIQCQVLLQELLLTPSYCNLWSLGLQNSTSHSNGEIICVIWTTSSFTAYTAGTEIRVSMVQSSSAHASVKSETPPLFPVG